MARLRIAFGLFLGLGAVILLRLLIGNHPIQLFTPQGVIAAQERDVIVQTVLVMLVLAIPMLATLFFVVWRYREGNTKATYKPKSAPNPWGELAIWAIPLALVLILWAVTWKSSHALDPQAPIASPNAPITIQVVALPWKWLFIYPQQNIATINYIEFPDNTPVHFELTADGPMSSFWIPQLGSQMYAMESMKTQLNLMASTQGEFTGKDTEINGEGYSGMTFTAKAVSEDDFNRWLEAVRRSSRILDAKAYPLLAAPSSNNPPEFYAPVDAELFDTIMMKNMTPTGTHQMPDGTQMKNTEMNQMNMPGM